MIMTLFLAPGMFSTEDVDFVFNTEHVFSTKDVDFIFSFKDVALSLVPKKLTVS